MSRTSQCAVAAFGALTLLGAALGLLLLITSTYAETAAQETALATLAFACAAVPYIAMRAALYLLLLLESDDV